MKLIVEKTALSILFLNHKNKERIISNAANTLVETMVNIEKNTFVDKRDDYKISKDEIIYNPSQILDEKTHCESITCEKIIASDYIKNINFFLKK